MMTKKILKEQNYLQNDFGGDYMIRSGDTLSGIARKFGTTVDAIMAENPDIKNKNKIYAGEFISIPRRLRPPVDKKRQKDPNSVDLTRKDKGLIKVNAAKVLSKAKSLAGYNTFQALAKKAGWKLTCQYGGGEGMKNTWAIIETNRARKTADIFIGRQAFLGAGGGIDRLQDVLFKITQIIEAPEVEGKRRRLSNSELKVFKDFIEDFAGAWMSTTVAHELEHAKHSFDGMRIGGGDKSESEVRAREAEAQMTARLNRYVQNLIGDLRRLLENVYGFNVEELNSTVQLLPKLWAFFILETKDWFDKSKHVFDVRREDPAAVMQQLAGDPDWVDAQRKEKEQYAKLMKKYFPGRKSQKQPKLASSPLNFLNNLQREEKTKVNKILEGYILNHTSEKFEETPFGQIVVDEINKAVAEIPEIKLALDYLSEQDDPELEANTKNLGRAYAEKALKMARTEMVEKLPGLVAQIIDDMLAEVSPKA